MLFNIIGHKQIINSFLDSIKNEKVNHFYVFEGIDGIGKKLNAKYLSFALTCDDLQNAPCFCCKSCKLNSVESHPDVKIIELSQSTDSEAEEDKKKSTTKNSKSISVDVVRETKNDILIRPFRSSKKVYIVCDAEKLTDQAQNSFLKILEEPPSYAVIIFTTSNPNALLETVMSRASVVKFNRLSDDEIINYIKNNYKNLENMATPLAVACEGSIGRLLSIIENEKYINSRKEFSKLIPLFFEKDEAKRLMLWHFFNNCKENINELIDFAISLIRDVIMVKGKSENYIINKDFINIIYEIDQKSTIKTLAQVIDLLVKLKRDVSFNANISIATMALLIK